MADLKVNLSVNNSQMVAGVESAVMNLGELKRAILVLKNTSFAGKTTEEIATINKKAGELKQQMKELNAVQKSLGTTLGQNFAGSLRGVAASFEMAAGAVVLFGGSGQVVEELQKKMLPLIAVTQAAGEVEEMLATRKLQLTVLRIKDAVVTGVETGVKWLNVVSTNAQAASEVALTVIKGEASLATKALAAAQWLWNAAILANPIVLVIAGIIALVAVVYLLVKAFGSSDEATEKGVKKIGELRKSHSELLKTIQNNQEKLKDLQMQNLVGAGKMSKDTYEIWKLGEEKKKSMQELFTQTQAAWLDLYRITQLQKEGKNADELSLINAAYYAQKMKILKEYTDGVATINNTEKEGIKKIKTPEKKEAKAKTNFSLDEDKSYLKQKSKLDKDYVAGKIKSEEDLKNKTIQLQLDSLSALAKSGKFTGAKLVEINKEINDKLVEQKNITNKSIIDADKKKSDELKKIAEDDAQCQKDYDAAELQRQKDKAQKEVDFVNETIESVRTKEEKTAAIESKFLKAKALIEATYTGKQLKDKLHLLNIEKKDNVEQITGTKELNAQKVDAMSQTFGIAKGMFKENTAAYKAFAIAQATMDTYAAANTALKSAPPPFNFILMGATIAAGLMNVGKIAGAFTNGGIIQGSSYSGDNLLARVNSSEMILNSSQQSNLFAMANNGNSMFGGGDVKFRISGSDLIGVLSNHNKKTNSIR